MFSKRQARGFTLIEILVVIVIVGTVLSIVVLSTGIIPDDEEILVERTRITALLETVQDEAMMQGREFGLEIMTSAYRFVEFDPLTRQWMEVPDDELYRLRELPEGIEFELYIDDTGQLSAVHSRIRRHGFAEIVEVRFDTQPG